MHDGLLKKYQKLTLSISVPHNHKMITGNSSLRELQKS